MTGFWLVSYVVLWVVVVGAGLVIMALAREIETLHRRLDSLQQYVIHPEKRTCQCSGECVQAQTAEKQILPSRDAASAGLRPVAGEIAD